jgi:hypothetical protein
VQIAEVIRMSVGDQDASNRLDLATCLLETRLQSLLGIRCRDPRIYESQRLNIDQVRIDRPDAIRRRHLDPMNGQSHEPNSSLPSLS